VEPSGTGDRGEDTAEAFPGADGAVVLDVADRIQPAGRVFALVLSGLRAECLAHSDGVLADEDPEELHSFRVAIRRTRSLLRAAVDVLPEADRRALRDELRWLADLTSPVRDLDVLVADLPGMARRLQPELRDGMAPLAASFDAERSLAVERLAGAIRSERFDALQRTWHRCGRVYLVGADVPAAALHPAGLVADAMVRRSETRMRRAGRRALRSGELADWHDLRKSLKQFRYVLAEVAPLYPAGMFRSVRRELPDLQDLLGGLQDHHVQAELLVRVGASAGGEAALAAGVLANRLHRDVHRLHRRCAATWRSFDESAPMVRLRRELEAEP
jgi:CHAD domain-containing protein